MRTGAPHEPELLHDVHLLFVGEAAVHYLGAALRCTPPEAEGGGQDGAEPFQGLDAFGEDDDAGIGGGADTDGLQLPHQCAELRGIRLAHVRSQFREAVKGGQLGRGAPRVVLLLQRLDPCGDRGLERRV